MSRLIFDADTLGGTTTLSSADAVGNFTITVPAVDGTMSVKDASGDATFRNLTLTGAVLAGAWNGTTIAVAYGGTGATTLTGYVKGNGTSAMTASATIPSTDITGLGTMSVQNATAVTITGGTANSLVLGGTTAAAATVTTLRINSTLSLAGATGTSGQVLTSNGASAPTWQNIAGSGTVTSIDVSGGTTGLTTSGGPVTGAGTITLAGTLAAVNGGTGQSSYVIGNLLYASTTTALSKLAIGTTGQVLTVTAGIPAWATPTTGTVTSVAGTGTVNGLTLTGTVTSSGSLTLGGTLDLSSPPAIGGTAAAAGSFTTLNSSGNTRLGGLSGNQSLQVNNVTSAVNYATISGATTGGIPNIAVEGSDANINFGLFAKNNGFHFLFAAGGVQFAAAPTASAVNYLRATGSATGASPIMAAIGSDTNAGITLTPKGTGALQVTGTGFSPNFTLTDAATIAWDTTTAGGQTATFTFVSSNRTFGAPTNLKNGAFYALAVIQNAGSNTLTWNSVFKWTGGTAPTLSTAASAKDYFVFRSDGTNLYEQGRSQAVA